MHGARPAVSPTWRNRRVVLQERDKIDQRPSTHKKPAVKAAGVPVFIHWTRGTTSLFLTQVEFILGARTSVGHIGFAESLVDVDGQVVLDQNLAGKTGCFGGGIDA